MNDLVRPAAPVPPPFSENGFSWFKFFKGGANLLEAWNERLYSQPIFMAPAGRTRFFYLNNPELIAKVLQDKGDLFVRSRIQDMTIGPVLGNGLLSVDGDQWRQQRKIMAPVFQPRQVQAFESLMHEATQRLIDEWREKPPKRAFDIIPATSKLTLDFIANALFGGLPEDDLKRLARDTESSLKKLPIMSTGMLLNPLQSLNQKISTLAFRKQIAQLDDLSEKFIQRYRSGEGGSAAETSLLGRLIAATEKENDTQIDTKFVRDQVATFLLAGHETTGKAIAWTLYLLAIDPKRRSKLLSALDEDGDEAPYLEWVINESLRLYPPAISISRDVTQDIELADRNLKAGDTLMISPWLVQRNPKTWQEADKFWPERWETEDLKGERRYAYLPFGAGPRVCIGGALAMKELKIMLTGLLKAFTFELSDVKEVAPMPMVTLGTKHGIWMKVTRRT